MSTFVKPGYRRVSPGLENNVTSGRQKVQWERKCRVCGAKGGGWGVPLTRHHLVPQAWFLQRKEELRVLRNANANIVPLCEECHRGIDSTRDVVGRLQKRALLRQKLHSDEVSFILQIRGRHWLETEYPRDP